MVTALLRHIIVADPRPLITLARAHVLDALLVPRVPVVVPDMVCFEVTRELRVPGARSVADWLRARESERVHVVRTFVFAEFEVLCGLNARTMTKNRCELAAGEVLSRQLGRQCHGQAEGDILIVDDSMAITGRFLSPLPDHVVVLTLNQFLKTAKS